MSEPEHDPLEPHDPEAFDDPIPPFGRGAAEPDDEESDNPLSRYAMYAGHLWLPSPEYDAPSGLPMIEGLTHGYREYYVRKAPRAPQKPVRRPFGFGRD